MPDRLQLTQNAQFFKTEGSANMESLITEILNTATSNKVAGVNFIIESFRTEENFNDESPKTFKYSIRVFPTNRTVYFLDDSIADVIHAYIVLIEYDGYIAILKKNCANISKIVEKECTLINSGALNATFNDDDVEFQKISLRNMTVSSTALRAKSYEAVDLKGVLSTHAAGRSIPYFLKIRQDNTIKTISSTGRLIEASARKTLKDIAEWVKIQIELIQTAAGSNTFLNSFAGKVALSEITSNSTPTAILVETNLLEDAIRNEGLVIKYKRPNSTPASISESVFKKLLYRLEKVYDVNATLAVLNFPCTKLKLNTKSITFSSKILSRFLLEGPDKNVTLQEYIIKRGFYSITFSDPSYMYFMNSCFKDNTGVSEIDSIIDMLQAQTTIRNVRSEKGNFSSTHTAFDTNSMFAVVENIHCNDDYIFCDDLGVEWADHITLNLANSCICFIHSKHGDIATSASKLHDVVGQGIKNLGYMYLTKNQLLNKVSNKFLQHYNAPNVRTNISRIRRGNPNNVAGDLNILLKDYRLHRKCILSCSFISKQNIETEFNKIKNGEYVQGHIIQLLWILSSFSHAVKEMNIVPLVYCNP